MVSHVLSPIAAQTMGDESELSKDPQLGVPQGGSLSPTLLHIFIDSLAKPLESAQVDPADKAAAL